jgi:hypothetical protein
MVEGFQIKVHLSCDRSAEHQKQNDRENCFSHEKPSNGGVDAAARIQSSFAAPIMMRNTLPPLASNDLLGR